jgi:Tfp pilus assembly protein PilN
MRVTINFASREFIIYRRAYAVLAVLLVCLVGFTAANWSAYADYAVLASAYESRMAGLKGRQAEASAKLAQAVRLADRKDVAAALRQAQFANEAITKKAFSWTAFLNRLEDVVPEGVAIKSISPNFESLSINISGTATNMDRLTEFLTRLTRSQYFEDLPPSFQTSDTLVDKDIGKSIQTFSLKVQYIPEGQEAKAARRNSQAWGKK